MPVPNPTTTPVRSLHTPGPWEAVDDEIVARNTDMRVADVPLCDGTNPTEWQANLRLIAAAPDLLTVLKRSLDWLASYPGGGADHVYEAARIAIAKAEGE